MTERYINSVQEFNDCFGLETLHPLVGVASYEHKSEIEETVDHYGIYALFLKENKGCKLSYGRTRYDFDEMTVTSFAPGQVVHVEPMPNITYPRWTALVFHPTCSTAPRWARTSAATSFSTTRQTRPCISLVARLRSSVGFST